MSQPPGNSALGTATRDVTLSPYRTLSPGHWLLPLIPLLTPKPRGTMGSAAPPHNPFPSLLSPHGENKPLSKSSQSPISPGKGVSPRTPSPRIHASQACPHLLNPEPREESWELVPVLSARQEQLQVPTRIQGPPRALGAPAKARCGSLGATAGSGRTPSAGSGRLPPPGHR